MAGTARDRQAGQGELEISGFLQLVTQIVFCDVIKYSNFESLHVAETSRQIATQLVGLGLEPQCIQTSTLDVTVYSDACQRAVTEFAQDARFAEGTRISLASEGSKRAPEFDLAGPDVDPRDMGYATRSHEILIGTRDDDHVNEILSDILKESKSAGADEFMSAAFRRSHKTFWNTVVVRPWSLSDTNRLLITFRYYLNQELAKLAALVYMPAVARARIVHRRQATLLATVEKAFGEAVRSLEPSFEGVPSVASALVSRGKAEPRAIIEEAIVARSKAAVFRAALAPLTCSEAIIDSSRWHEARVVLKAYEATLLQDLDVLHRPTFLDAVSINIFGLVPGISVSKILEWSRFRRTVPHISFLSEFAKTLADQRLDHNDFCKLYKNCIHPA